MQQMPVQQFLFQMIPLNVKLFYFFICKNNGDIVPSFQFFCQFFKIYLREIRDDYKPMQFLIVHFLFLYCQ